MIASLKVYETLYQNDVHEILYVMIIKSKFSDNFVKNVLLPYNNQYSHDHPFCSLSKTTNTVGLMGRRAADGKDDVVSSKRDLNHCILWSLSRLTQLLSDGGDFLGTGRYSMILSVPAA